jgi:hypothetical protein
VAGRIRESGGVDRGADTHDTSYLNLRRLCSEDHDAKTHHGARLERHHDQWWWHPPPDPNRPDGPAAEPRIGPVGEHLTHWNLQHLPAPPDLAGDPGDEPGCPGCPDGSDGPDRHDTDPPAGPPRLDFAPDG